MKYKIIVENHIDGESITFEDIQVNKIRLTVDKYMTGCANFLSFIVEVEEDETCNSTQLFILRGDFGEDGVVVDNEKRTIWFKYDSIEERKKIFKFKRVGRVTKDIAQKRLDKIGYNFTILEWNGTNKIATIVCRDCGCVSTVMGGNVYNGFMFDGECYHCFGR